MEKNKQLNYRGVIAVSMKRCICILLTLVVLICLMPTVASAATRSISIAGFSLGDSDFTLLGDDFWAYKQFTVTEGSPKEWRKKGESSVAATYQAALEGGAEAIFHKVSDSEYELILNGATFETKEIDTDVISYNGFKLIVTLYDGSTNELKIHTPYAFQYSDGHGIESVSNLIIRGAGKLNISGGGKASYGIHINIPYATRQPIEIVDGANVNITGTGISGIYAPGGLTVIDSTLNSGDDHSYYGIDCGAWGSNFTAINSTITGKATKSDQSAMKGLNLSPDSVVTITNSTITLIGGLKLSADLWSLSTFTPNPPKVRVNTEATDVGAEAWDRITWIQNYKYVQFLPEQYLNPQASVGDVAISGTVGSQITPQTAVIALTDAAFKAIPENTDISSWFENLPAGLSARIKTDVPESGTTATVEFSGTPTTKSPKAMEIMIPARFLLESDDGSDGILVDNNLNSKWSIASKPADSSDFDKGGSPGTGDKGGIVYAVLILIACMMLAVFCGFEKRRRL